MSNKWYNWWWQELAGRHIFDIFCTIAFKGVTKVIADLDRSFDIAPQAQIYAESHIMRWSGGGKWRHRRRWEEIETPPLPHWSMENHYHTTLTHIQSYQENLNHLHFSVSGLNLLKMIETVKYYLDMLRSISPTRNKSREINRNKKFFSLRPIVCQNPRFLCVGHKLKLYRRT